MTLWLKHVAFKASTSVPLSEASTANLGHTSPNWALLLTWASISTSLGLDFVLNGPMLQGQAVTKLAVGPREVLSEQLYTKH